MNYDTNISKVTLNWLSVVLMLHFILVKVTLWDVGNLTPEL